MDGEVDGEADEQDRDGHEQRAEGDAKPAEGAEGPQQDQDDPAESQGDVDDVAIGGDERQEDQQEGQRRDELHAVLAGPGLLGGYDAVAHDEGRRSDRGRPGCDLGNHVVDSGLGGDDGVGRPRVHDGPIRPVGDQ